MVSWKKVMVLFRYLNNNNAPPLVLTLLAILTLQTKANLDDGKLESVEILKSCGYTVRQYKFVSQNNAVLGLVRATNPLFNDGKHGLKERQPILYLQGTTLGNALTLISHQGIKPQDFSHLNAHKMSKKRLLRRIGDDPSARNFFFLALNMGHEVWFLNRRGFEDSFRRVQDQNRTLMDALKVVAEALVGVKRLGDWSPTGGLTFGRPRGDLFEQAERTFEPPFDSNTFLVNKMFELMQNRQSSDSISNLGQVFSPLSLLELPESALLLTDPVFKQQFIDSVNPDFWNFSLDEQAEWDLPKAVDFVLKETNQKRVHLVGLSTGGSIILLSHAVNPELKHKVGASILWAPAVNLGSGSDIVFQLSETMPFSQTIIGPIPPLFVNKAIQLASQAFCTSTEQAFRACRLLFDSIFGYSGKQAVMGPIWWGNTFVSSPGNELRHLGQMAHTNKTCKYNYNTAVRNLQVYGQPDAPCYNFSKIETPDLFFYGSEDDRLVSLRDMEATFKELSVNYKLRYIQERGIRFNHLGYIIHEQNARLAVVPTLRDIASVEARYHEEEHKPRLRAEEAIGAQSDPISETKKNLTKVPKKNPAPLAKKATIEPKKKPAVRACQCKLLNMQSAV